jgi:hypothetical protein
LSKGSETCLLQVILLFAFVWLSIVCWSFHFVRFVSFLFLLSCYFRVGVVNALNKEEIEDQCGSRNGGWSLPCVMSD